MKKAILIIVVMFFISTAFAERQLIALESRFLTNAPGRPFPADTVPSRKDKRVQELQEQIKLLKIQMAELKGIIAAREADIENLKALCRANGISLGKIPSEISDATENGLVANKPVFGIYLGENLTKIWNRFQLTVFNAVNTDVDDPSQNWFVNPVPNGVKAMVIGTFNNQVYMVQVSFIDSSENNYEAIKNEIKQKYEITDKSEEIMFAGRQWIFQTSIGNIGTLGSLKLKDNFEDNELIIIYTHIALAQAWQAEIKRHKAAKVSSDL